VLKAMEQAIDTLRSAGAAIIESFTIKDLKKLTKNTGFCSRFRYDLNHYLKQAPTQTKLRSFAMLKNSQQHLEQSEKAMQWASAPALTPEKRQPPCIDVSGDPRRKALLDAVIYARYQWALLMMVYLRGCSFWDVHLASMCY